MPSYTFSNVHPSIQLHNYLSSIASIHSSSSLPVSLHNHFSLITISFLLQPTDFECHRRILSTLVKPPTLPRRHTFQHDRTRYSNTPSVAIHTSCTTTTTTATTTTTK
uniref:Uncharacterized protein n=1 Tax=Echinococcus granulosus TaxID=6210 RepID=A0A068WMP6_ECHGR|nr:hypothetical protein EgrG_000507400 [Echinococcus granulosus]